MHITRRRCGVLTLAPSINVVTYLLTYLDIVVAGIADGWTASRSGCGQ